MAVAPVSEWLCEPCEKDGEKIKARTRCFECRELLCEPCSISHLRSKLTENHHLLELVQFMKKSTSRHDPSSSKQTPSSMNEDELASDFLEHVTLTENTVLYRGVQVAVQSTTSESSKPTTSEQTDHRGEKVTPSEPSKPTTSRQADHKGEKATQSRSNKPTTSRQSDPRRLTATQCLQYSVKRPEDEDVCVRGVLCVSHNVVIVDYNNDVLKLFDQSGTYLSSTSLKYYTWGITCVGDSTFATCGTSNTVYLWSVRGNTVVSEDVYHVDHSAQGIHYNGTYYCVLHRYTNTITVLNRQGRQVRKITMEEGCGKKFRFGWDIHMDSDTHKIYVPYWDGVLCMTVERGALWFTPLSWSPWGITEIQGTLCVADYDSDRLHMITKEGEYVRKLLDQEDLGGKPKYVCYGQDGKLYVSYCFNDKISVFTIT